MEPNNTVTFTAVSPETYNRVCAEPAAVGLNLAAIAPSAEEVHGTVETHGCLIEYCYSRKTQTAALTVKSKPWLLPMSMVLDQIKSVVGDAVKRVTPQS